MNHIQTRSDVEAMKQALEALELANDYEIGGVKRRITAITTLRTAIEAVEKQEPVAWSVTWSGVHCGNFFFRESDAIEHHKRLSLKFSDEKREVVPLYTTPPAAPVQDIGVEQDERVFARIEARKNRDAAAVKEHSLNDVRCQCCGYMTYHREHMGCIRAAQTAPVQEPVAWKTDDVELYVREEKFGNYNIPLYTHPAPAAQRQSAPDPKDRRSAWVGLTDEEIRKTADACDAGQEGFEYTIAFARAIEAKLKEKNT